MSDYANIFEDTINAFVQNVEKHIERPLTQSQKSGLTNAGSLMFLEAMMDGFYFALGKDDESARIDKWLKEIDGFVR